MTFFAIYLSIFQTLTFRLYIFKALFLGYLPLKLILNKYIYLNFKF